MTNTAALPVAIPPDHPQLVYSGFAGLTVTPDGASAVRPVPDSPYRVDSPGCAIRFRTKAATVEALFEYVPKTSLTGHSSYNSEGVVQMDGKAHGYFTRPSDDGGLVRIALASGDTAAHTWNMVPPYSDAVIFRGLRLPDGAALETIVSTPRPVYVAYGDSITHGYHASVSPTGYAWQLADAMGWDLLNMGFGSRTVVPADAAAVAALKPDVVTILLGVNDCLCKVPVATYAQRYTEALDTFRKERPSALIVAITLLAEPGKWAGTENIEDYRKALRDLVAKRHDRQVILVEGPDLIPSDLALFADGLHPNDTGFAVMAERLAKALSVKRIP